jgi:hypothetical protein
MSWAMSVTIERSIGSRVAATSRATTGAVTSIRWPVRVHFRAS